MPGKMLGAHKRGELRISISLGSKLESRVETMRKEEDDEEKDGVSLSS